MTLTSALLWGVPVAVFVATAAWTVWLVATRRKTTLTFGVSSVLAVACAVVWAFINSDLFTAVQRRDVIQRCTPVIEALRSRPAGTPLPPEGPLGGPLGIQAWDVVKDVCTYAPMEPFEFELRCGVDERLTIMFNSHAGTWADVGMEEGSPESL